MKRTHRALLLVGIFVLALTLSATNPAHADPVDDYAPDGVGELIKTPTLNTGQKPTLFEQIPSDAYSFDFVPVSSWHVVDNAFKRFFNGWANLNMWGVQSITRAAISLSWHVSTFNAHSSLGAQLQSALGVSATHINSWLLPSMLAIGALAFLISIGRRRGKAIDQGIFLVAAGILAITMASHPQAWVGALSGTRDIGVEISNTLTFAGSQQATVPIPEPNATFDPQNPTNTTLRINGDVIWRTYVVSPWCLGEFGSLKACKDFGYNVLSKTEGGDNSSGKRYDYITGELKTKLGGDKAPYKHVAGHNPMQRVIISLFALVSAIAFAALMIVLALTSMAFMIMSILLLYLGPVFVAFIAVPGTVRSWGLQWFQLLVSFTIMSVAVLLVQSAALSVSLAAIQLSSSMGWFVASAMSLTSVYASFLLLRHLREIFGSPTTGALSGAMRLAGGALALRAFRSSHATTKAADSARKPARTTSYGSGGTGRSTSGHHPMPSNSGGQLARAVPQPSPHANKAFNDYPTHRDGTSNKVDTTMSGKSNVSNIRTSLPPQRTPQRYGRHNVAAQPAQRHRPRPQDSDTPRTQQRTRENPYTSETIKSRTFSRAGHPHLRQSPKTSTQSAKRVRQHTAKSAARTAKSAARTATARAQAASRAASFSTF